MRLRRLDLTRYGKFTDRSLDFGEPAAGQPDLHIIHGPNEAGKSTAFAGYLDLLFGIETQSRYGYLHPYATMRVGACLELSTGPRELVRIKRRQQSLLDASNQPVPEAVLLGELGGLDREAYRTMFSLDDDTLEAGGKSILASNGELGELLFSASAGLSDLSRTLHELRQQAERFTRPNARKAELQVLSEEIHKLKDERSRIDTLASEYNRLVAARDGAAGRYEDALRDSARARAELDQLRRMIAALPRMAALQDLRVRLERFAGTPAAPTGWLAELPALEQAEHRYRSALGLAAAEVVRLSTALDALQPDESGSRLVGRLDRLTRLRARHVTAEFDLPERRRELARADGEVAAIMQRIGRDAREQPRNFLLTAPQSAALDRLLLTRSGIEAKVSAARDELSQANDELGEAKQAIGQAEALTAPVLALIASALAAARESDHAARLGSAARARIQQAESLASRLAALRPWSGTIGELAALALPDAAEIQSWHVAIERAQLRLETRQEEVAQLQTELEGRMAERAAIGEVMGLLSDQSMAEIRRERETAWATHRRELDAETANAFEAAMRRDDIAGATRIGHERDVARMHEVAQAIAVKRAETERARVLCDEAAEHCRTRVQVVELAAAPLGVALATGITPTRLLAWIALRTRALEVADLLRQAEWAECEAARDQAAVCDGLSRALRQAGVSVDPEADLTMLVSRAEAVMEGDRRLQTLREAVATCEREVRKRGQALQKAAQIEKTWLAEWREACRACWLGEEGAALHIEVVREMLAAAASLEPALQARASLADRIQAMEADQAAFAQELRRLTQEAGIDPGQDSGLDLAKVLLDRAERAERIREDAERLREGLAAAQEKQRQITADKELHTRRVDDMRSFMKAGSLIDLAGRLRDAAQKADLEEQAGKTEREILDALNVPNLAEARTITAGQDIVALTLEEARLATRLQDLEQPTRELFATLRQAEDRIAAIGGDDAAARIEERRRTKLLDLQEKALRYLRLRAGIVAADRALRAYRDRHRSSMMEQASDVFRSISRGGYRALGVQPDKDADILVALGADGGSKPASDLSKGTRFQLYLALRAAGYLEVAKTRRPVPFIADDIMETFDDLRAEETLRVFQRMARVGQVIYLTHHTHLCAIAERVVPGVRIHALAA